MHQPDPERADVLVFAEDDFTKDNAHLRQQVSDWMGHNVHISSVFRTKLASALTAAQTAKGTNPEKIATRGLLTHDKCLNSECWPSYLEFMKRKIPQAKKARGLSGGARLV